jgi:DNA-directed RNA polymerase specialized sigma24 family protein
MEDLSIGIFGLKTNFSEDELNAAIRSRNPKGAEILYDDYSASLFTAIHCKVQKLELAEDILQNTLLEIWNNIDSYDPASGRLAVWMMGIARRLSKDALEQLKTIK